VKINSYNLNKRVSLFLWSHWINMLPTYRTNTCDC